MASRSRVKKDSSLATKAVELFKQIIYYYTTEGMMPAKTDPVTRPMKGLSMPMIIISTAQVLRQAVDEPNLRHIGLTILDWMWRWGWDQKYGGILYCANT